MNNTNNDRIYYSHEAEKYAMRDRNILAVLFLSFGIGFGAAIALLFAPNSGKKTRKQLINNAEDTLQSGRDAADPMIKRAEATVQDGRDAADPMIRRAETGFSNLKETVKEAVKEAMN